LNNFFFKRVCYLLESGIYEEWLKDTLERNNDAARLGFVKKEDKKYEYMPLLLNHFKSLFYIQIMSFILTLIVLIFEIIHFRFKTKKQRYRKVCCIKYKRIFRKMILTVMNKAKIIRRQKNKEKVLQKRTKI
jgi:hypothetical protein